MLSKNASNRSGGCPPPPSNECDPFDGEEVIPLPDRTHALVRGLDLVLEHHNASNVVRAELSAQVHAHLDTSSDETVWLKKSKFLLTYPLSKYLKNEPPPAPIEKFQATGCLRKWMKQRLCCFNRRNTHLWYSWLQSKRATLPVSDDVVDATYEKHLETLTRKDPGDDLTIHEIFEDRTFVRLLDRVRRDIAEQFVLRPSLFEEESPSNSACFEMSRGNGGQQAELLCLADLCYKDKKGCFVRTYCPNKELVSMRYDPVVITGYGRRFNIVTEVKRDYGIDEWSTLVEQSKKIAKGNKCCTIQAVLEPMKVRVISKGEALAYYSCKPLQKALHTALRNISCFRLIGRPLSPTDLIDLKEDSAMWDKWFSIDYSAATDGLSWKYAGRILRYIIQDIPDHQRELALDVLGPHALHYPIPGSPGCRAFKGMQQNGQLMGSILSFPILCLANLGVYLRVTSETQKHWNDDRRLNHVLINGDDMVYSANESLWDPHVKIAGSVGLEMSVGKAYRHKEYVNINSMSLHYDLQNPAATPVQIDYLNVGLFFGQHKVQSKENAPKVLIKGDSGLKFCDSDGSSKNCKKVKAEYAAAHLGQDPENGLAVNINTILNGCYRGKSHEILSKFLDYHKDDLKKECAAKIKYAGHGPIVFYRSLFVPISLGGFGVVPPCGWKYRVTSVHRYVANAFLKERNFEVATCHPLPGYPVEDLEDIIASPWSNKETVIDEFQVDGIYNGQRLKYYMKTGAVPFSVNSKTVYRCLPRLCERALQEHSSWEYDPRMVRSTDLTSILLRC